MAQLRSRYTIMNICQQNHWDKIFCLSSDSPVIDEIFFWKNNLKSINHRFIVDYSLPQVFVYSDASHSGCGAWAKIGSNDDVMLKCNFSWSELERGKSSTWRELKGIALALLSFTPDLQGKRVQVFTDNQGVVSIINKGSMNVGLHNMSIDIASLCRRKSISLQIQWVPREENVLADQISKEIDFDDWGVSHKFFVYMDEMWGPHTVDRFADQNNKKLTLFNSKYSCPGTNAVDAFSVDWSSDNNWLVPPIYLIGQVLRHVRVCKAKASLVVPCWPSAPFWPLLFSEHSSFSSMVSQRISFPNSSDIYVQGRNRFSVFGSDKFKSDVICVRLDGRR